jgi:hypothetical protein
MGKYFSPAHQLYTVGRSLCGSFSFKQVADQLQPGEYLIGCYTSMFNPAVVACPYLENEELFNYFDSSSIATFWAVSKADFEKYVR